VHEYDIADLLGHHVQAVTGTYARSTPEVLEEAVNKLALPRGTNVIGVQKKGELRDLHRLYTIRQFGAELGKVQG
jgi:hypothetical protein